MRYRGVPSNASDAKRIPKNLYTSHPKSTPAILKQFATPVIEASFISTEIKRLIAYSGGLLNYDDFSILREPRKTCSVLTYQFATMPSPA